MGLRLPPRPGPSVNAFYRERTAQAVAAFDARRQEYAQAVDDADRERIRQRWLEQTDVIPVPLAEWPMEWPFPVCRWLESE